MSQERPILFSAPMVRAILDGRKTQTRRAVNPQPVYRTDTAPAGWEFAPGDGGLYKWPEVEGFARAMSDFCPYGLPSDRLWVRETFFDTAPFKSADLFLGRATRYAYRADDEFIGCHKWKPSIHMPRRASRILLEVTAVRAERLRDISEADCVAEGAAGGHASIPGYNYAATPAEHYMHIWESINGPGSWAANPWVWVIEFRRAQP